MRTAANVKQESTTVGTGDLTLDAALTGFRRFRDVFADGATQAAADWVSYYVENSDGSEWEFGAAQIVHGVAEGTLKRSTAVVFESSNANALVNFSAGTKTVRNITPPDMRQFNRLVQAGLVGDVSVAGPGGVQTISWNQEWVDTDAIFTVGNIIEIPNWVDRFEVTVSCEVNTAATYALSGEIYGFGVKHHDPQTFGDPYKHGFTIADRTGGTGFALSVAQSTFEVDRPYVIINGAAFVQLKVYNPGATAANLDDRSWIMVKFIG